MAGMHYIGRAAHHISLAQRTCELDLRCTSEDARNALWYGDSDSEERYALNLIMQNIGDRLESRYKHPAIRPQRI
jgi:hypothetical protein